MEEGPDFCSTSPDTDPQAQDPIPTTSQQSIRKNIHNIINFLDSPLASPAQNDIAKCNVLQGVVAYVEVRSDQDNRSQAIERQLRLLGATTVPKLTNDVTHVVFKDGRKMTRERATKRNLHLVSVLWVDSCKQTQERVPESLFPVNIPDNSNTPLCLQKMKKQKSMQPKDFDVDLAHSAERVEKRRRRAQTCKGRSVEELIPGNPAFFVAETQEFSPMPMSRRFTPNITIPDTPPSMKELVNRLRNRHLEPSESSQEPEAVNSPLVGAINAGPLQRRLFDGEDVTQLSSSPGSPIRLSGGVPPPTIGDSPTVATRASPAIGCSPDPANVPKLHLQESPEKAVPYPCPSIASYLTKSTEKRKLSTSADDDAVKTFKKAKLDTECKSPIVKSPHTKADSTAKEGVSKRQSASESPLCSKRNFVPVEKAKRRSASRGSESGEGKLPTEVQKTPKGKSPKVLKTPESLPDQKVGKKTPRSAEKTSDKQKLLEQQRNKRMSLATEGGRELEVKKRGRKSVGVSKVIEDVKETVTTRRRSSRVSVIPSIIEETEVPAVRGKRKSLASSTKSPVLSKENASVEHIEKMLTLKQLDGSPLGDPNTSAKTKRKSLIVNQRKSDIDPVNASPDGNKEEEKSLPLSKAIRTVLDVPKEGESTVINTDFGNESLGADLPNVAEQRSPPAKLRRKSRALKTILELADEKSHGENKSSQIKDTRTPTVDNTGKSRRRSHVVNSKLDAAGEISESSTPNRRSPRGKQSALQVDLSTRNSPELARKSLGVTKKSPGVKKKSPRVTKKSPGVAKKSPRVTKKSPGVTKKSPGVTKISPAVTKKSPGVNKQEKASKAYVCDSSSEEESQEDLRARLAARIGRRSLMEKPAASREVLKQAERIQASEERQTAEKQLEKSVTEENTQSTDSVPGKAVAKMNKAPRKLGKSTSKGDSPQGESSRKKGVSKKSSISPSFTEHCMKSQVAIKQKSATSRQSLDEFATSSYNVSLTKKIRSQSIAFESSEDMVSQSKGPLNMKRRGRPAKNQSMSGLASELESSALDINKQQALDSDSSIASTMSWKSVSLSHIQKQGPKATSTLVMTSLHYDQQDVVKSVVKSLGRFDVRDSVSSSTTHVIVGEERRTLNILHAITYGCWLLSYEWVLKSLEAGQWLDETDFEVDIFPAAKKSRLHVQKAGKPVAIFKDCGLIYVTENTVPPKSHLVKLLKRCGAKITSDSEEAEMVVGNICHASSVYIKEKWVLDSVTHLECLDIDEYRVEQRGPFVRSQSPHY